MADKLTMRNPKTGRPIVEGGATWRRLVKEGAIEHDGPLPRAPAQQRAPRPAALFVAETPDEARTAARVIRQAPPAALPPGHTPMVVGNKVVGRAPHLTSAKAATAMRRAAVRVIAELRDDPAALDGVDDIGGLLDRLLCEEVVAPGAVGRRARANNVRVPDDDEDGQDYDDGDSQ